METPGAPDNHDSHGSHKVSGSTAPCSWEPLNCWEPWCSGFPESPGSLGWPKNPNAPMGTSVLRGLRAPRAPRGAPRDPMCLSLFLFMSVSVSVYLRFCVSVCLICLYALSVRSICLLSLSVCMYVRIYVWIYVCMRVYLVFGVYMGVLCLAF